MVCQENHYQVHRSWGHFKGLLCRRFHGQKGFRLGLFSLSKLAWLANCKVLMVWWQWGLYPGRQSRGYFKGLLCRHFQSVNTPIRVYDLGVTSKVPCGDSLMVSLFMDKVVCFKYVFSWQLITLTCSPEDMYQCSWSHIKGLLCRCFHGKKNLR